MGRKADLQVSSEDPTGVVGDAPIALKTNLERRIGEHSEVCAMLDVDTYLTTKNTSAPIIRLIDGPVTCDNGAGSNKNREFTIIDVIAHALGLLLIAGVLLYFYLVR